MMWRGWDEEGAAAPAAPPPPRLVRLLQAPPRNGRWSLDNVRIVREITDAFAENRIDDRILDQYFAPDFEHVVNGRRTDLRGYSDHLARYMREYERFRIADREEPIAAGDKVVTAYTLEGQKRDGETEEMAVMAIWQLENGRVKSLHEVDAPVEH